jgi:glycosyltransferase involved in cell wall biosynthesis
VRILYLQPFTSLSDHFDSGVVGYGMTSGSALVSHLRRQGHHVDLLPARPIGTSKVAHAAQTYEELGRTRLAEYDCVFIYNVFHQFAAEVRRILYESDAPNTKLVGYTHGSHWDPSDLIRGDYPLLRHADLGNVLALDAVLLVSDYIRDTMARSIRDELGDAPATRFLAKAHVVGLTIDDERMAAARRPKDERPRLVFNHSATVAKRPGLFFRTAVDVLAQVPDAQLTVTRRFTAADPGFAELAELRRRFPDRVELGDTMPVDEYFGLLWQSNVQVSTATHESFGVSTVEAIYAGCCSVLPDVGCYPEVTGPAGIYQESELAETLVRYLRDPEARSRTAKSQREAIDRYLPANVAARITSVLETA